MKIDYSLGELKKNKKLKSFVKRELSNRIRLFFDSELPYETRTSLFIAFSLLGTHNWFFLLHEM